MWSGLGVVWALCLIPGGWGETDASGGARCKPPPPWTIGDTDPMKERQGNVTVVALLQASWSFCLVQAAKLDGLRQQLENEGLKDINYMVVNDKAPSAHHMHSRLAEKLPEHIPLYGQHPSDTQDIWHLLNGEKDDFLVYDRCGYLTYHISLPYSILTRPYIRDAIRKTYCTSICADCSLQANLTLEECAKTPESTNEDSNNSDPAHGESHHRGHGGHHHGHEAHHHGHEGHSPHGHDQPAGHDGDHHQQQQQVQTRVYNLGQHVQQRINPIVQQRVQFVPIQQQTRQQHLDLSQVQVRRARHTDDSLTPLDAQQQLPWGPHHHQHHHHVSHRKPKRWKARHSWEWPDTSVDGESFRGQTSWCWHWRHLVEGAEQSLWHCHDALPTSWQWQMSSADGTVNVSESWQWRPEVRPSWPHQSPPQQQPNWSWTESGASTTWAWH